MISQDNPRGATFLAVNWTFFALATIIITLRFVSRFSRVQRLRIDDALILIAWVLAIVYGSICTDAVRYGLGQQMAALAPANLNRVVLEITISEAPAGLAAWLVRMSFCYTMLIVVHSTKHRRTRWLIWINIAADTLVCFMGICVIYARCGTHTYELLHADADASRLCMSYEQMAELSYAQSVIDCISNILLACIPCYLIHALQLPRDIKAGSWAVVVLGFAAFGASIGRAIAVRNLTNDEENFTYEYIMIMVSASLQINILMILASLPLLRPLYKPDNQTRHLSGRDRNTMPKPPPTEAYALQKRPSPGEKDMESQSQFMDSGSEDHILWPTTSLEKSTDVVAREDVPLDRIQVQVDVEVRYQQRKANERLAQEAFER